MLDIIFSKAKWHEDESGLWLSLCVESANRSRVLEFVRELKPSPMSAHITAYRKRRSLNANAYLWVLLQKIAEAVGTDKDEVYIDMLGKYGIYTHIIVKEELVERIKSEWRLVKELGEVTVKGKKGIQLQCYFGSSGYDTKEMSVLIDGVVSECRDLGIDTMTPAELDLLKSEWGR